MSEALYAKGLLRLATSATGAGIFSPCDAKGEASNPVCGDRVTVTIALNATGSIARLGHDTHACVLAQASAAILGAHLTGATSADVSTLRAGVANMLRGEAIPPAPFTDYAALLGAAQHRNRHTCVLLPLDAVINALGDK